MQFRLLGNSFTFEASLFPKLESFVCQLYGLKCANANDGRYMKFCSNQKAPEPQKLPPTRDALLCKRVSYVTAIIKRSLQASPSIPSPNGYGWTLSNGILSVTWMLRKPAPDEILQLISCNCRTSKCKTQACVCKAHGLGCTDLCGCLACENESDDGSSSSESSSESSPRDSSESDLSDNDLFSTAS